MGHHSSEGVKKAVLCISKHDARDRNIWNGPKDGFRILAIFCDNRASSGHTRGAWGFSGSQQSDFVQE